MKKITIVDYGMGNLLSVKNMIQKIGSEAEIVQSPDKIYDAHAIILPGVGHFGKAMELIQKLGIKEALDKHVLENHKPILGICLGMQLLFERSEEGNSTGLGYIKGDILKFNFADNKLKVPHMGWNAVTPAKQSNLFLQDTDEYRFYFVHSYFASCTNAQDVAGKTKYGIEFCSAVQHENISGVQFHPEKSHRFGMHLLTNYVNAL